VYSRRITEDSGLGEGRECDTQLALNDKDGFSLAANGYVFLTLFILLL
jgi:hypothetical protein